MNLGFVSPLVPDSAATSKCFAKPRKTSASFELAPVLHLEKNVECGGLIFQPLFCSPHFLADLCKSLLIDPYVLTREQTFVVFCDPHNAVPPVDFCSH